MSDGKKLEIGESIWYIDRGGDFDPPCVIAASILAEATGSFLILSDNYVRERKKVYTDPGDPRIGIEIQEIMEKKIALVENRLGDMRTFLKSLKEGAGCRK